MSYDLQVVSKKRPLAAHVTAFLDSWSELTAEGSIRDGYALLTDAAGAAAEVDGPSRIEDEDVPDAAAGAIRGTGWLLQVSIKASSDATWATDVAIHLARSTDGVVYDPQLDRVTWPKGFQPPDRDTGEIRIEQISLVWFTSWPSDDPELPTQLLEILESALPDALPRRYGGFEPLPSRFVGEDAARDFARHWVEEAVSWSPGLSWSATPPCLGGSAGMSQLRRPERAEPGTRIVRISLQFDGRAFARDPDFTDRVVHLFRAMATGLKCVYAAASVGRDVIAKRGGTFADGRTEMGPFPRSARWIGLPASPTWLAWFGQPYTELVRKSLAPHAAVGGDGSLFLRMGQEPMNADELAEVFPPLPARLLARPGNERGRWIPGASYTLSSGPPSQPAEVVPDVSPEPPLAADLLQSVLDGLAALFTETRVAHWTGRVREVAGATDPAKMAAAYLSMSQGSTPGTFHDIAITALNGHRVDERKEAWVNQLLDTFQSIGLQAARAIAEGGPSAKLDASLDEAAARRPSIAVDAPSRTRIIVYGMHCTSCGSEFVLDSAVDSAAAARWAIYTAPRRIGSMRSRELVTSAFALDPDPIIEAELNDVRPEFRSLKLPVIRLPYNRPNREPNDHCPVCKADDWRPIAWRLEGDPLKLTRLDDDSDGASE